MKNYQKGSTPILILSIVIIILLGTIIYFYSTNKSIVQAPVVEKNSTETPNVVENTKPSNSNINNSTQNISWKKYSDGFIEFEYPSILSVQRANNSVILSHSIAYTHPDPCDFKGDSKPSERINDFGMTINIVNKGIKAAVESKGEFPGWDYVSKNPTTVGGLKGYKIQVGVEGCGEYQYYLSLAPDITLIINQKIVTELSDAVSDKNKYLQLPGIITPAQEKEYIDRILSEFLVTN